MTNRRRIAGTYWAEKINFKKGLKADTTPFYIYMEKYSGHYIKQDILLLANTNHFALPNLKIGFSS